MEFDPKAYGSFFDQEDPERPLKGIIAEADHSGCYELDAKAVFKVDPKGYLLVEVSGRSCWPDHGSTTQTYCEDRIAVSRALAGDGWSDLIQACQDARWQVRK